MLVALRGMDRCAAADRRRPPSARPATSGSRCATSADHARAVDPAGAMVLVGTLSFNFQVLLPLLAHTTWHGTATTYALHDRVDGRRVGLRGAGRGRARARLAAADRRRPRPPSASSSCSPPWRPRCRCRSSRSSRSARSSVTFAAGVNSSLQLAAAPAMRGRVMALYSVVFLGSTPIGAPLVGWLAQATGRAPGSRSAAPPRWSRRPGRASPTPAGARARSS